MTRGPDHDIRKNSNGPITAYHDREASGTEEAFMTASIGAVKDIDALETVKPPFSRKQFLSTDIMTV